MKIRNIITSVLIIAASFPLSAKDFKGAEYRTKEAFTYGRFEVRMKSAQKEGMLSSFFLYHDGDTQANWNEIDLEVMGRYSNNVQFNTITPGQVNHVRANYVAFNPSLDFHTYAFEWTPQYVSWFIDGYEVYRQTGPHIQTLDKAQKIMMNVWNPAYANWAGAWSPDILPAFAFYDWVSCYAYTPGSGSYGTGNNFTLKWKDNFDSWDQSRWDKASHTWDGNNCDFIFANAVFKDGMLVLCLTDSYNTGYQDKNPPVPLSARAEGGKVTVRFSEEVEQTSAETASNYSSPGVSVAGARLLEDQKTVELSLSGFNPAVNNSLIISGIKDRASAANTMSARALTMIKSKPLTFPLKINVGGQASNGYLADQEWKETSEYGYQDGGIDNAAPPFSGTSETEIYKTALKGMVSYKVRVPNGKYSVKLMLMENYFTEYNKRVFDIFVENSGSAADMDIYSIAGKNKAYEKVFNNITVNDGVLDIYFSAKADMAQLYGLVIEQLTTDVQKSELNKVEDFNLRQNYPNPFNGMTKISYTIPDKDNIVFSVYDILGNMIFSKELGLKEAGKNEFFWKASDMNGKPLSSGVYLYSVKGSNAALCKKMILLN